MNSGCRGKVTFIFKSFLKAGVDYVVRSRVRNNGPMDMLTSAA
jgi:hypothetical protein